MRLALLLSVGGWAWGGGGGQSPVTQGLAQGEEAGRERGMRCQTRMIAGDLKTPQKNVAELQRSRQFTQTRAC